MNPNDNLILSQMKLSRNNKKYVVLIYKASFTRIKWISTHDFARSQNDIKINKFLYVVDVRMKKKSNAVLSLYLTQKEYSFI